MPCAARPVAVYYKHVADHDVRSDWDRANREYIARHSVKPDEAEQAIRSDPLDMDYEVTSMARTLFAARAVGRRGETLVWVEAYLANHTDRAIQ